MSNDEYARGLGRSGPIEVIPTPLVSPARITFIRGPWADGRGGNGGSNVTYDHAPEQPNNHQQLADDLDEAWRDAVIERDLVYTPDRHGIKPGESCPVRMLGLVLSVSLAFYCVLVILLALA